MGAFILGITLVISVILSSFAAPGTVFLQSKSVEENNVLTTVTREPLSESIDITSQPNNRETPLLKEEVTTLERFYRIYEDGTIEFKIVLSNGLAQYQKITNKGYCSDTIQIYEGYNSERLPDNTYRTIYYIADENGYRIIRREFDTKPPVLPIYVPHVPEKTTPVKCDI